MQDKNRDKVAEIGKAQCFLYLQKTCRCYNHENQIEIRNFSQTKAYVENKIRNQFSGYSLQRQGRRAIKMCQFYSKKLCNSEKPLELVCPICMDLLVKAVTTPCGHTFCIQCLDQTLLFHPNCPVCRGTLKYSQLVLSKSMDEVVSRFSQKLQGTWDSINYCFRSEECSQWLSRKFVNPNSVNKSDLLDVRDTQFIWCRAIVQKVQAGSKGEPQQVLIHYLGWNSIYDEVISLKSQRISNAGFYTERRDIPHYCLSGEENLYSFVVVGQENHNPHIQEENIFSNNQGQLLQHDQVLQPQNDQPMMRDSMHENQEERKIDSELQAQTPKTQISHCKMLIKRNNQETNSEIQLKEQQSITQINQKKVEW